MILMGSSIKWKIPMREILIETCKTKMQEENKNKKDGTEYSRTAGHL